MKAFVVRLNPDPREENAYSAYPTALQYRIAHERGVMNGFHEAANFLPEDGVVQGYLPPKHLTALRDGEPFILVTVTAKKVVDGSNLIVGIQANCRYEGEKGGEGRLRKNGTLFTRQKKFNYHYSCLEKTSLLLPEKISNAFDIVLDGGIWRRHAVREITKSDVQRILREIKKMVSTRGDMAKLKRIIQCAQLIAARNKPPTPNNSPVSFFVSPKQLEKRLKIQAMIGEIGECIAVTHENKRLEKDRSAKIDHVARKNTAAGYDIYSKSTTELRYIEVKSSTRSDSPIYVSPNEIRTLKKLGKCAYLYIVLVSDIKNRTGRVTREINDPFKDGESTSWIYPALYTGNPK